MISFLKFSDYLTKKIFNLLNKISHLILRLDKIDFIAKYYLNFFIFLKVFRKIVFQNIDI